MEDIEIVNLYWDRDEKAIVETQNKYGNYCFAIANNILHDQEDSEECVNDTYKGAWDSMPPHRPLILSTYLGKITRRLSLNVLRRKNAYKRGNGEIQVSFDEIAECIPDEKSLRDSLEEKYLSEMINDFLSELKESERKVFVCRYWYFESVEEIARRFGFGQSKVKMMLKRTRDKLRDYLLKEGVLV